MPQPEKTKKKSRPRQASKPKRTTPKRWSRRVTETSDALDLPKGIFRERSPGRIAASLKRAAQRSQRRKSSSPFRSAMSMLNFYINRAGAHLSRQRKAVLDRAKVELRSLFGRA